MLSAPTAIAEDINDELIIAAQNGGLATMTTLIRHGANVDEKDAHGSMPLIYAAERGNSECI